VSDSPSTPEQTPQLLDDDQLAAHYRHRGEVDPRPYVLSDDEAVLAEEGGGDDPDAALCGLTPDEAAA